MEEIKDISKNIAKNLRHEEISLWNPPEGFYSDPGFELYKHQKRTVAFLNKLKTNGRNGALIMDDPGLGKTISILSFLRHNLKSHSPNLIICPPTILDIWIEENKKLSEPLKIFLYYGENRYKNKTKDIFANYDVILTSYTCVRREYRFGLFKKEKEEKEKSPFFYRFDNIILDEAHNSRNSQTQLCVSLKSLTCNFFACITGTAIVNKISDIKTLFNLINYEDYSDERFTWNQKMDNIATNPKNGIIEFNKDLCKVAIRHEESHVLELPKVSEHEVYLNQTVIDREFYISLFFLCKSRITQIFALLREIAEIKNRGEKDESILKKERQSRASLLLIIQILRMACSFIQTAINTIEKNENSKRNVEEYDDDYDELRLLNIPNDSNIENIVNIIKDRVNQDKICKLCLKRPADTLLESCVHTLCQQCWSEVPLESDESIKCPFCHARGKKILRFDQKIKELNDLKKTRKDLENKVCEKLKKNEEIKKQLNETIPEKIEWIKNYILNNPPQKIGDKIVIYSNWKISIFYINEYLKKIFPNLKIGIITGETPISKRSKIIKEFQNTTNIDILLITMRTCSEGIKLTSAKTVIFFDPSWNHSSHNQAYKRVHRPGQKNEVNVYYLYYSDTIESNNMMKMVKTKRDISENIVQGKTKYCIEEIQEDTNYKNLITNIRLFFKIQEESERLMKETKIYPIESPPSKRVKLN